MLVSTKRYHAGNDGRADLYALVSITRHNVIDLGINFTPGTFFGEVGEVSCRFTNDVITLPWVVMTQRKDGITEHLAREPFQVATTFEQLLHIPFRSGKVLPAGGFCPADQTVDTI